MPDLLFIALLALLMFGPKNLPGIAAQIGRYLAQFRSMKRELLDQLNVEMLRIEKENHVENDISSQIP